MSKRRASPPSPRPAASDAGHAAPAPEAREDGPPWTPAGDDSAFLPTAADLADKGDGETEDILLHDPVDSPAPEDDIVDHVLARQIMTALARQQRPMRLDGLLRVLGLPRRARKELEAALAFLAR